MRNVFREIRSLKTFVFSSEVLVQKLSYLSLNNSWSALNNIFLFPFDMVCLIYSLGKKNYVAAVILVDMAYELNHTL